MICSTHTHTCRGSCQDYLWLLAVPDPLYRSNRSPNVTRCRTIGTTRRQSDVTECTFFFVVFIYFVHFFNEKKWKRKLKQLFCFLSIFQVGRWNLFCTSHTASPTSLPSLCTCTLFPLIVLVVFPFASFLPTHAYLNYCNNGRSNRKQEQLRWHSEDF